MSERLPPLQGLYYFYLAAETGSFKQAAEKLYVSAAAMSQQIRQLEERVEVQLFERQHRKVVLTPEGVTLHHYAKQAFRSLQDGVRQISQDPDPLSLSLSVLPSFAQHWLVPRLGEFSQQHPDLSVMLMPKNSLIDFRQDRVDLCVRYGLGDYEGLHSVKLMDDHLYPVCHPLYLKQHPIESLNNLSEHTVIDDARPDMNWQHWLQVAGYESSTAKANLRYQGAHVVIEGALAVQGIALVRHSLAWKYIQQGVLVKLGKVEVKPRYSYYLVAPKPYFNRDKIKQFSDWIQLQAHQFWAEAEQQRVQSKIVNTQMMKY
ncbi:MULTISPECIES: LysR substrate-binding domain-containing protein [unclassified Agarivorans]|uniref:LysR substrate-binding domain-containing protein n=1 Tax=unclassified Agarivorans TaxID=2636026 RepID=UPI0026E23289|nr:MULTISPECIES: LysR substrate-binding domain-containing protein [unclassified Agarivorans]MDO6687192.1 LysR substrate-binding domain-containing protein [Agarivorans sp. 3_MG-2023]MDO6716881.1 LysR substrate-binding domain-containing protein [Agarivorans sp. 2_MG-2023]